MVSDNVVLAIDTSNYTTSMAIMSCEGDLVANLKIPLPVKHGERGLRQSDAVFAHTVNLPRIADMAKPFLNGKRVVAIGVSDKPRNVDGSYMPCFLSGVAVAENISMVTGAPLYKFSHQCGHIMAAVYSSGAEHLLKEQFAAFHISGGTTELVRVNPFDNGFSTELLGGTFDLNAGQVIDRIGVYMGFPFPAGASMERAALENCKAIPKKKISVKDMRINLSGLENMALKLYSDTNDPSLTAAFVFDYVGRALSSLLDNFESAYGKSSIVCAGGVMCNSIIKKMLSLDHSVYFAEPQMSSDNAVGVAALTIRAYNSENKV